MSANGIGSFKRLCNVLKLTLVVLVAHLLTILKTLPGIGGFIPLFYFVLFSEQLVTNPWT